MSHREFCVRITLGSLSPSLPQRLVIILATFTVLSFVTFQRPCRTIAAEPSQGCQEHKNDVLNHERRLNRTKFLTILPQDDCELQEVWYPCLVGFAFLCEPPYDLKKGLGVQRGPCLPA